MTKLAARPTDDAKQEMEMEDQGFPLQAEGLAERLGPGLYRYLSMMQSKVAKLERFRSVVEELRDVILILGPERVIDFASPSVREVLGSSEDAVVSHRLEDFVHPDDIDAAQRFVEGVLSARGGQLRQVLRMQKADGDWLYMDTCGSNQLENPKINGILLSGRDVTERVALEERLSYEALHDPLTGLSNRVLFRDRVDQALEASPEAGSVAVLLLDLDRFKSINDTLGEEAGDELLKVIGARLLSATRGSDTVARLGGDEFAVLLTGIRSADDVTPVLKRVEAMLAHPVRLRDREVVPSGSIGVAISRGEGDGAELIRQADVAMYAAKELGLGASSCFFEPKMQTVAHQRAQFEIDLKRAIENNELSLVYQPLVELTTGRAYGVEALVRWNHPQRGPLDPDQFIPLAEETGLITALGRWVLNSACRTVSRWHRLWPRREPLLLSVNLSARQLVDDYVLTDISDALMGSGLQPGSLVLELTESALAADSDLVIQRLNDLHDLGVQLAVDDFGTGYSSLAYLQRFPMDILKIDRRFINDLDRGGNSSALARAVLGLGASLHLRTVAEGIETESQLAELQAMGCDYGQGYLFSPPLDAAEAERFIGEGTTACVA